MQISKLIVVSFPPQLWVFRYKNYRKRINIDLKDWQNGNYLLQI